ncbi:MAG: hypothetical protein A4S09_15875 [Proteobacteria bacterium SG_bin7]|nr:MAG: hypothetical protein A4S09_15875 [Proteobacteria bacterium SG_bin7]
MKYLLIGILFLVGVTSYNNCAPEHQQGASSISGATAWSCTDQLDNLSLFSKTYHPFLMNNCASCHSGGGPGPGAFASSGVQLAFDSFNGLGFSRINARALDGHSSGSGPRHTSAINSLTDLYVDGLQSIEKCQKNGGDTLVQNQDDPNRWRTHSKAINPRLTEPVTVSWDLSTEILPNTGYVGSQYAGVTLSAQVQIFQRPGVFAYVISSPRLSTTNTDIHIQSLLFKLNGNASPAQRAFYYVDRGIRIGSELVSGGAMVVMGDVRTTDVLSVSIGKLERVTLPPPVQGPDVSFGVASQSVTEGYQIINIPVVLSKPWDQPTSAEIYFGPDTTIKDQCCRTTINDDGMDINVSHFDRDIQDYDVDPLLPMNGRLQFEGVNVRGRYLVTFGIGETSKMLKIKVVQDSRDELNEILHLKIDPTKLSGLRAASTLQDFRLTIVDEDAPYSGTALTYTSLMSNGGILANECLRCHNSVLNRGGYDITNYEQLIRKAILRPGDPANSIMFLRMDADNIPGLDPMPLTGLIDPAQRFDVKQWILQGALNN